MCGTCEGFVPGICHSTNLTVGHRYLIQVSILDGVYNAASTELPADTDEQLANLTVACGLKALYPKGINILTRYSLIVACIEEFA